MRADRDHFERVATRGVQLLLAAVAMLAVGCGDDDAGGDAAPGTTAPVPTSTTEPTTTLSTTTTTTEVTTTTEPSPEPTTPYPGGPLANAQRCENPEGFSVSYPQGWSVNDGSVVSPCSQFDPETFTVPDGTDERVAAITAYIDAVPFSDIASGPVGVDGTRAVTAVDGHQAIRMSGVSAGNQLLADGTPVTRYVIDLSIGVDDGPGTLFIDTVGGMSDYETNRRVLDAMVATIDLAVDEEPVGVVARFEGGGTPVAVTGDARDNEICLSLDTSDAASCVASPTDAEAVRSVVLGDGVGELLAGVAVEEVFVLEVAREDAQPFSVLPVEIDGADGVKGWAVPFGSDGSTELTWFDLDGNRLGSLAIG